MSLTRHILSEVVPITTVDGWADVRFLASEIEKLWTSAVTEPNVATASRGAPAAVKPGRRTGRISVVGPQIEHKMRAAIENGEMTMDELMAMTGKALAGRFKASRNTCDKYRNAVCQELSRTNS
jgi:hypothetical protein